MNNNMLKFLRILSPQNALIGFAVQGVVVVDAMRKGEIIRGIPVVANADDFFEYEKIMW